MRPEMTMRDIIEHLCEHRNSDSMSPIRLGKPYCNPNRPFAWFVSAFQEPTMDDPAWKIDGDPRVSFNGRVMVKLFESNECLFWWYVDRRFEYVMGLARKILETV